MKKVAVILSGCGYLDGAEIHEAVVTMLALDRAGARMIIAAPDIKQMHTIDHLTGNEADNDRRNVLVESARIARGEIIPLKDLKVDDVDGVVFPGGFGAAKNLCTFAVDGPDCKIDDDARRIILDTLKARKPLGVMCIAPALAAKATEDTDYHPLLTIGSDTGTAAALEKMGAKHQECPVNGIVYDEKNNIISTPAYMLGPSIANVADGIEKLVAKLVSLL